MNNIENISTSIITTLTIGELKEIFNGNNNLELLRSGNFSFCIDVIKKFGFNFDGVNLENLTEVSIDFVKKSKKVLQGATVNIYDKDNKLISKKVSYNSEDPFCDIRNYETQIHEILNFKENDINEFIKENGYSDDFVNEDVCSLIHISGFELDEKKFKAYNELVDKCKQPGNENLEPYVKSALGKIYSFQELYVTKSLIDKNIKIMHNYTPYILNADRSKETLTVEELYEIIEKLFAIANISIPYDNRKFSVEDVGSKNNFINSVTNTMLEYYYYFEDKKGYKPIDQVISRSVYSQLCKLIFSNESRDNEKIPFKIKVIGTEQVLIENVLGNQKTLNKSI